MSGHMNENQHAVNDFLSIFHENLQVKDHFFLNFIKCATGQAYNLSVKFFRRLLNLFKVSLKSTSTDLILTSSEETNLSSLQFDGVENLDDWEYQAIKKVYETRVMGTPLGLANIIESIRYIITNHIPGDIVECGVWRGGSSILAALTLERFEENSSRTLWLYDTFEGMTKPTSQDVRMFDSTSALEMNWDAHSNESFYIDGYLGGVPAAASLKDVKNGFNENAITNTKLKFIQGKVEDTLLNPSNLPESIAFLKLDTDWYESTKVELEYLWNRVVSGGVIILDDYDYWKGTRSATDEFFEKLSPKPLLIRLDHGRIVLKQNEF